MRQAATKPRTGLASAQLEESAFALGQTARPSAPQGGIAANKRQANSVA